jgi:hypothetical protein
MKGKIDQEVKHLRQRAGIVAEVFQFLWETKLWWMAPMIILLLLLGILIIFAETSPVAPFVYTLF